MKTGTARSLLPGRAPRWRYVERAPPARRRTGVVRSGGGNLDALLNEILEKHQSLFGEAEDGDGEEEESAMKRMLIENQDYADRQDVWPDGQDDSEYIRVPPLNIGPDPKKGSIGQQVSFDYQKAMLTDAVDPDHMRYWFTTPPGGWNTRTRVVKKPRELPGFFANARNRSRNRPSISELELGQKIRGVVSEVWLYHGIKVDIGYDYDGLLPMKKETWPVFGNKLDVGDRLDVAIAKIWNKDFYRWPVQLRALSSEIQQYMIPVKKWDPPVDMRGKSIEEIERHTSRRLPTESWVLPDDARHEGHPKSRTRNRRVRKIVTSFDRRKPEQIEEDYYDDMYDAILDLRVGDV